MVFVLDASVAMAWCFEDEGSAETEAVLDLLADDEAVVPPLWRLEVTNVLLGAERRGRMTEAHVSRFVALLEQLPIRVDVTPPSIAAVLTIAVRYDLSAYDAAYLALAERLALPIATLDRALQAASRRAGVRTLIG